MILLCAYWHQSRWLLPKTIDSSRLSSSFQDDRSGPVWPEIRQPLQAGRDSIAIQAYLRAVSISNSSTEAGIGFTLAIPAVLQERVMWGVWQGWIGTEDSRNLKRFPSGSVGQVCLMHFISLSARRQCMPGVAFFRGAGWRWRRSCAHRLIQTVRGWADRSFKSLQCGVAERTSDSVQLCIIPATGHSPLIISILYG